MTLFWVVIAVIYALIVYLLHKLFYKEVRGDENSNKRLWKIWGIQTAYWQGALLVGLGIISLILVILKWADLLPKTN